ncbi:RNA polymerase sigma-70 factor, ECF subfamily [Dethiosulfatibacter aminovorans DSM 17477]|uniref:RNA polymerase sigma-70 factor, ECF subfamily n=1 Tax=Dethiosulfatibacter aminovorans DSM 17477 TaxID=1121476 RepID=A0A1M6FUY8_9FIRM|nr:sigma-70 family RNA polymerase sigma factor [Dethiosulfatibacter aminovorans]SHJ01440.1 RNA polymerase sigma-70 factor, ECF subfamily [Dethiosulfatibacter aminovorans DSM 17477]
MNDAEILLIKMSQKGDIDSFETLIKDYKKVAYNIALKYLRNKEDAEDVSQESLIKVFKNIGKFNMNSSFKTWMYRIVVNTCLDFKRKKKENTVSVDQPLHSGYDEFYMELEDEKSSPENIVDKKLTSEMVMEAIEKLDDDFKTVIILRDINDFSYDEISRILSCNIGTVKSRISRGRQKLKEILEENVNDYN